LQHQQTTTKKMNRSVAINELNKVLKNRPSVKVAQSAIDQAWKVKTGDPSTNVKKVHSLVEKLKAAGIPAAYDTMSWRKMRVVFVSIQKAGHARANKGVPVDKRKPFDEHKAEEEAAR
jgi:hypothetical protein